jgi:serum/glucocorticoid-regulated kinase 2
MSPSLRSKESALSVGNQSQSSDQSNGETAELPSSHSASPEARKVSSTPHTEEPEKLRNKKLKKYKENAEKVLSLFASPRQS